MEWLKIVTSNELVRISTDEIVYILADGNYCDIMLANGSTHKMTFQLHYFEDYFKQLSHSSFHRVGRSLIVNKKHIRVINVADKIIKFGGHTIADKVPSLRISKLGRHGRESMYDFADALREYGFVDAVYMTGGNAYSFHRDSAGNSHVNSATLEKIGKYGSRPLPQPLLVLRSAAD